MGKIIALILAFLGISGKASSIKRAKVKKIDKKLKDSTKKIKSIGKKVKKAKKESKNLKTKAADIEKEIKSVKKGSKERKEIKDSKDAEDFLRKFQKKIQANSDVQRSSYAAQESRQLINLYLQLNLIFVLSLFLF